MRSSKGRLYFEYLSVLSINALIWSITFYFARASGLPDLRGVSGSLMDLLFGSASLALFMISIFIGVVAVIGLPYIVSEVRKSAQDEVKEIVQPVRDEMRGRVFSAIGYLRGESSIDHERFEVTNKNGLAEAITLCEQSYELLQKVEGPAEFTVLNNLLYYYCVYSHNEIDRYRSRSNFLLDSARRLLQAAIQNKSLNLQLTACRAILQFGRDREEKLRARDLLIDIKMSKESSEELKKEAQRHLHHSRQFV
jgi:hypothetical protein